MTKKVALLINSMSDGGAEKLVKELLDNLYNCDEYEIELICLEKNNIYNFNNVKIGYISNSSIESNALKFFLLPWFAFKLARYVSKNRITIVQSHLFRANYVNVLSRLIFGSRHTVQVVNHGVISRYKKDGLLGKINLFLIKLLYPFADEIISVSNIVQDDMQKLFGFKNEKKVIYNMFDINAIQRLSREKVNDFKFDNTKKYLISVGRLITIKKNKDLLKVLPNLNNEVEVIFIGSGDEKDSLIGFSSKLGISHRVHFLGWLENPYKYIKNSDLLVCTSGTESFGNVLVESMACGTPVLSTKCGGPEEIIQNGINGSLVDIGNINDMIFYINKILSDDKIRDKYIKNGSKYCKKFDVKEIIIEYQKVLELK